ncbi:EAL and HDOD domain-containing protein [Mucisphaera sp.]|uniref:EAL and HDOD domain-containing protein n=1 Tax=Mucisphaera sp. TaxID=2913024 RepID=UPI003D138FCB
MSEQGTSVGRKLAADGLAGRTAVLDGHDRLVGYEVDVRVEGSGVEARALALVKWFEGAGRGGSRPIFVRMSRRELLAGMHLKLPADRVTVCLPGAGSGCDEVLEACETLKAKGYRLGFDGFVDSASAQTVQLLELADFVRLDLGTATKEERLSSVVSALSKSGVRVIALGVEDHKQRALALRAGVELCQGYFFLKPKLLPRAEVETVTFSYMELIAKLNEKELDFDELAAVIKSDVSLSTQLLKYLNSPAVGLREHVASLHQALVLLGEKEVRKWASSLVLDTMASGRPKYLSTLSLVRGRFCEGLAGLLGEGERKLDFYLVGLLSLLDVITHQSIDELMMGLPVSRSVRLALLGSRKPMGQVLALTRACERGDGVAASGLAERLGVDPDRALALYGSCLAWGEGLDPGVEASRAA